MSSPLTLDGPSARAASVAARLESTPPLSPMTTRWNPTLRTSSWIKPRRMRSTNAGLMARGRNSPRSVRFAGTLMPDPAELIDGQFQLLTAEKRVGEPLVAHIAQVQGSSHHRLVSVLPLLDE